MPKSYKIDMTFEKTVTFYLEAEDEEAIYDYLEFDEDWGPEDMPGLVDHVEETESGFEIKESSAVTPNFRLDDGELVECDV